MERYVEKNKKAWEFNAYDFWCQSIMPEERAKADVANPIGQLKQYAQYFEQFEGVRIANICGSCGKKAIPLVLMGADVTVFDISEDNKKYAMKVAAAANVKLNYEVGDVLEIDMSTHANSFDVVFMEGGILHYFHDINEFMAVMNALLKKGGKMICSDFHPFNKIIDALGLQLKTMNYFSTEIYEDEMAHARFFNDEVRKQMPLCSYRKYTLSEIINSVVSNGFALKRFDEYPAWDNQNIPGEFVLIATKS